ncbi:bifunctional sugar-1-phosphate nucleotidylyltransferase/acetyltransferase [Salinigranum sp. GCM10025319]|uniref:bifunctional sugar-1-phosphate nucleotidylyltransferase/acetyltransferase n=1 Tax=Salinigranum sp. GCM10025319 TaxID=3252687 RepID=UPI00361E8EF3
MQTVVLAAGEGTRMRPLTASRPKPMLPVADRPLVAHTADAAVDAGASRLILVVGYGADAVRSYFGTEYRGVPVAFAVQDDQRGTADAVRAAATELDDGPFVVLNGDALYDTPSLERLYASGPAVGSFRVDDPSAYGVLVTDEAGEAGDVADEGEGPRVTGVIEKPADPPSDLINTGAYHFPGEAQAWLDVGESERGELELTDVLERTCGAFDVRAVAFERWLDVGRPWELLAANEWKLGELSTRIDGAVHDDAVLDGTVVVEDGARVRSGVVIEGPALVRENATVGPNAYVRGATVVGEGATVGHAVEVKNAVLMEDATVGHLSYVGDSVLGRDVNFGAGTKVANLRHDGADVRLTVKGERVSTGRRKFGVVVGDGTKTGINASLNAGVVLSEGARVAPGEIVTRDR